MRALTVWQPHAYLIGLGVKLFETRSWRTKYRGLLAIHAAKIQAGGRDLDGLVEDVGAHSPRWTKPYDRHLPGDWNEYYGNMNHGGIEALVVLQRCEPGPKAEEWLRVMRDSMGAGGAWHRFNEAASFGDFTEGRWAWHLRLELTVNGNRCGVIRGQRGLWRVPGKVEEELLKLYKEMTGQMICRECGCTEDCACVTVAGPCGWAEDFFCTSCRDFRQDDRMGKK